MFSTIVEPLRHARMLRTVSVGISVTVTPGDSLVEQIQLVEVAVTQHQPTRAIGSAGIQDHQAGIGAVQPWV